ncbi:uncharacterized protein LOC106150626 [Lingula anatina]|uniref:Uncharacterized protein LOC106150626 n=1 Tax=Lingula anatina TaxID=7574 RepID=A0A1S3GYN4_LINAN|nr:uncharacterized protein LOC106150626 [Lingula anatina]|eukprot:XP_013378985.1 uncharacterized protein LOC106150626 [Lingula anatina]
MTSRQPIGKNSYKTFVAQQKKLLSSKYPFLSQSQILHKVKSLWAKCAKEEKSNYRGKGKPRNINVTVRSTYTLEFSTSSKKEKPLSKTSAEEHGLVSRKFNSENEAHVLWDKDINQSPPEVGDDEELQFIRGSPTHTYKDGSYMPTDRLPIPEIYEEIPCTQQSGILKSASRDPAKLNCSNRVSWGETLATYHSNSASASTRSNTNSPSNFGSDAENIARGEVITSSPIMESRILRCPDSQESCASLDLALANNYNQKTAASPDFEICSPNVIPPSQTEGDRYLFTDEDKFPVLSKASKTLVQDMGKCDAENGNSNGKTVDSVDRSRNNKQSSNSGEGEKASSVTRLRNRQNQNIEKPNSINTPQEEESQVKDGKSKSIKQCEASEKESSFSDPKSSQDDTQTNQVINRDQCNETSIPPPSKSKKKKGKSKKNYKKRQKKSYSAVSSGTMQASQSENEQKQGCKSQKTPVTQAPEKLEEGEGQAMLNRDIGDLQQNSESLIMLSAKDSHHNHDKVSQRSAHKATVARIHASSVCAASPIPVAKEEVTKPATEEHVNTGESNPSAAESSQNSEPNSLSQGDHTKTASTVPITHCKNKKRKASLAIMFVGKGGNSALVPSPQVPRISTDGPKKCHMQHLQFDKAPRRKASIAKTPVAFGGAVALNDPGLVEEDIDAIRESQNIVQKNRKMAVRTVAPQIQSIEELSVEETSKTNHYPHRRGKKVSGAKIVVQMGGLHLQAAAVHSPGENRKEKNTAISRDDVQEALDDNINEVVPESQIDTAIKDNDVNIGETVNKQVFEADTSGSGNKENQQQLENAESPEIDSANQDKAASGDKLCEQVPEALKIAQNDPETRDASKDVYSQENNDKSNPSNPYFKKQSGSKKDKQSKRGSMKSTRSSQRAKTRSQVLHDTQSHNKVQSEKIECNDRKAEIVLEHKALSKKNQDETAEDSATGTNKGKMMINNLGSQDDEPRVLTRSKRTTISIPSKDIPEPVGKVKKTNNARSVNQKGLTKTTNENSLSSLLLSQSSLPLRRSKRMKQNGKASSEIPPCFEEGLDSEKFRESCTENYSREAGIQDDSVLSANSATPLPSYIFNKNSQAGVENLPSDQIHADEMSTRDGYIQESAVHIEQSNMLNSRDTQQPTYNLSSSSVEVIQETQDLSLVNMARDIPPRSHSTDRKVSKMMHDLGFDSDGDEDCSNKENIIDEEDSKASQKPKKRVKKIAAQNEKAKSREGTLSKPSEKVSLYDFDEYDDNGDFKMDSQLITPAKSVYSEAKQSAVNKKSEKRIRSKRSNKSNDEFESVYELNLSEKDMDLSGVSLRDFSKFVSSGEKSKRKKEKGLIVDLSNGFDLDSDCNSNLNQENSKSKRTKKMKGNRKIKHQNDLSKNKTQLNRKQQDDLQTPKQDTNRYMANIAVSELVTPQSENNSTEAALREVIKTPQKPRKSKSPVHRAEKSRCSTRLLKTPTLTFIGTGTPTTPRSVERRKKKKARKSRDKDAGTFTAINSECRDGLEKSRISYSTYMSDEGSTDMSKGMKKTDTKTKPVNCKNPFKRETCAKYNRLPKRSRFEIFEDRTSPSFTDIILGRKKRPSVFSDVDTEASFQLSERSVAQTSHTAPDSQSSVESSLDVVPMLDTPAIDLLGADIQSSQDEMALPLHDLSKLPTQSKQKQNTPVRGEYCSVKEKPKDISGSFELVESKKKQWHGKEYQEETQYRSKRCLGMDEVEGENDSQSSIDSEYNSKQMQEPSSSCRSIVRMFEDLCRSQESTTELTDSSTRYRDKKKNKQREALKTPDSGVKEQSTKNRPRNTSNGKGLSVARKLPMGPAGDASQTYSIASYSPEQTLADDDDLLEESEESFVLQTNRHLFFTPSQNKMLNKRTREQTKNEESDEELIQNQIRISSQFTSSFQESPKLSRIKSRRTRPKTAAQSHTRMSHDDEEEDYFELFRSFSSGDREETSSNWTVCKSIMAMRRIMRAANDEVLALSTAVIDDDEDDDNFSCGSLPRSVTLSSLSEVTATPQPKKHTSRSVQKSKSTITSGNSSRKKDTYGTNTHPKKAKAQSQPKCKVNQATISALQSLLSSMETSLGLPASQDFLETEKHPVQESCQEWPTSQDSSWAEDYPVFNSSVQKKKRNQQGEPKSRFRMQNLVSSPVSSVNTSQGILCDMFDERTPCDKNVRPTSRLISSGTRSFNYSISGDDEWDNLI